MTEFIGVKQIKAKKMNLGDYNEYRGWELPANENPSTEGYLVVYADGYKSWSPKAQFEEAYREVDAGNMSFGLALEALKLGKRIARKGWNGKSMFLFLLPAGKVPIAAIHDPALRDVIESQITDNGNAMAPETLTFDALASIRMWTADKKILTGWLASQTDMLSDDWVIV